MGTSISAEKIQGRGDDKALAWGVLLARREGAGGGKQEDEKLHKRLSKRCREEHHEGCGAGTPSAGPGDAQPGLCFGLYSDFVSPAEVTPQTDIWKRLEVLQELFGVLSLGFRVP